MESIKRGIFSRCFNMLYSYYLPASSDISMTKSSSRYFSVSYKLRSHLLLVCQKEND